MCFGKNQQGQTILLIVLVMLIALSIGLTVSTRFIKNLSTISESDNSERALAVAEAAVERILTLPNQTLLDYIQNSNCTSDCYLEITGSDGVVATASITLSTEGSSDSLGIGVTQENVSQVITDGYADNTDLFVCWNSPSSGFLPSVMAYHVYGNAGSVAMDSYAINSLGSPYTSNGFDDATSAFGYAHCFTINGRPDSKLVRLRSFYNDVEVNVLSDSGASLPSQGIRIESVGQVGDAVKRVVVVKTESYVPFQYDFALFQTHTTEPLSN
ncbi:MAG: hypothetical protein ACOZAO_05420 [Patescibacteria group bacterium]